MTCEDNFFCINIACINIAFYRPIAITVQIIILSGYALFSWHMSCYLLSSSKYTTHCILIDCPDAPYNSSTTDLDISTRKKYYFIGDNITYRCNSNHSLVSGNLTRTCLHNGSWSGEQPVCRSEKELCSKRLILAIWYLFFRRNEINHQFPMVSSLNFLTRVFFLSI